MIDDPALPEVSAELAAARADEMGADTGASLGAVLTGVLKGSTRGLLELRGRMLDERQPVERDRVRASAHRITLWLLVAAAIGALRVGPPLGRVNRPSTDSSLSGAGVRIGEPRRREEGGGEGGGD
ncbi:hypothetical protein ABZY16_23990 [Streptomyces sp. NPDC006553]|uniref:hypothetical protein n=1 Tax=Streptomyces sp. NPDC006553 TaxID=3157180 RepID=UPI0033B1061A